MNKYTLLIYETEPDETGYWATVAELPGCGTSGETLDELVANAQDAIETWIEATIATGHEVPEPRGELAVPSQGDLDAGPLLGVIGIAVKVAA